MDSPACVPGSHVIHASSSSLAGAVVLYRALMDLLPTGINSVLLLVPLMGASLVTATPLDFRKSVGLCGAEDAPELGHKLVPRNGEKNCRLDGKQSC